MRRVCLAPARKRSQLLQVLDRAVEMGQQSQQDKRIGQLNMFAAPRRRPSAPRSMADALPDIDELPMPNC